jgi:pyruvate dehydrogenase E1 component alpha subunit
MTWKLPVIYVCENNGYAMGTSVERTSNVTKISDVANAFHMPHENVDGMDPQAVHEAFVRAAAHVRSGEGPFFLEINTYRYKGHSVSDPEKYRKDEKGRAEVAHYKSIDPINVTRKKMVDMGLEAAVEAIEAAIEAEMEDAVEFARNSPFPEASELYIDNYVQKDYPYIVD